MLHVRRCSAAYTAAAAWCVYHASAAAANPSCCLLPLSAEALLLLQCVRA
jgi:hypothetical protein